MVAIGRNDHVARLDGEHRTNGDRFLPDIEVTKAADLAHPIDLGALLLKMPAKHHLVEHFAQRLFVGLLNVVELGVLTLLIFAFCLLYIFPFGDLTALDLCVRLIARTIRGCFPRRRLIFLSCGCLRQK